MDVIYISEILGWEAILIDMFLLSQATGGLRRSGEPQCRQKPLVEWRPVLLDWILGRERFPTGDRPE